MQQNHETRFSITFSSDTVHARLLQGCPEQFKKPRFLSKQIRKGTIIGF